MATSKSTLDAAPKRIPNLRPRTCPPAVSAVPSSHKPETANTRRNPNASGIVLPSTTKRSTAPSTKATIAGATHAKTQKAKLNPSPVITPSKDKVHGLKSHKESATTKPTPLSKTSTPSAKPKPRTAVTRASSSIKTSTKVGPTTAPIRGRSPGAGTSALNKIAVSSNLASKKMPKMDAKTGTKADTKASLSRVGSAPNLLEETMDIQVEKEVGVPMEIEEDEVTSPYLGEKNENPEAMTIQLYAEEEEEKAEKEEQQQLEEENKKHEYHEQEQEEDQANKAEEQEEEKDERVGIDGDNEDQIEAVAETELEKETIVQVMPETVTPELATTIPEPAIIVLDVPVPPEAVPVVPAEPTSAVKAPTQGKKDAGTSNAAIEETRSKLIGQRKSKVLALVGAFESVM